MVRVLRFALPVLVTLCVTATLVPPAASTAVPRGRHVASGSYTNPLAPRIPGGGTVDSCADPTVLRGQGRYSRWWYMYCTTDPLNDSETSGTADPVFHPIPTMRSTDLVSWTYVGDALPTKPTWAGDTAFMWAPDVVYSRTHHLYYLSFVVTDTNEAGGGEAGCTNDSAIGVATSASPTGPWKVSDTPVVAPRRNTTAACDYFWTYDPDVLGDAVDTSSVLYYGSYYGGVFGQHVTLTPDGMTRTGTARQVTLGQKTEPAVDPAKQRRATQMATAKGRAADSDRQVTIGNRYEGTNVVRHDDWYYLFASATNCCNGPLTGYSVFAGRSRSPMGPFTDREGNSLLAGRVGGTPVVSMNGNRWVGTGHNSVFRDLGGQWWTVYHAVDRGDPYFAGRPGFTKRPPLLDPVDWVDGWPTVRAGRWASDTRMPAPAAQPGQRTAYRPQVVPPDLLGKHLDAYSDDFDGSSLSSRWSWVRPPAAPTYGVQGGAFRFHTQDADLYVDNNTASVLTEPAPRGSYVAQTKVRIDVPDDGCCHNFVQAGLVVYGSDDAFVKLANASIWETRQTEFAKEVPSAPVGFPRYGNTVVGPPGDTTWLRIVKRANEGEDLYTAYTSQDGRRWVRGGSWTHGELGDDVRIGLVSMGGPGDFNASFDSVDVWSLR
jgi:arabinan endo-1,5-alpha-L-arabinosidase